MPTRDPRGDQLPRMDKRLASRLVKKKEQLDQFRPLPAGTVRRLHDDLHLLLTYHSNAIEGNTLNLRETQMVLDYGVTSDGHPLREYLEATNTAEGYDAVAQLADKGGPITLQIVLHLHQIVMAKILDADQSGVFCRVPVFIRGAQMTPPSASQIPELMQEWVRWVNGPEGKQHEPVTRAVIAHHGFEALHCFVDGNGRVGRLLLNLMLMREGYPPALLLRDWRARYILALQRADTGEYGPLLDIIGRAVESALDLYLEACEATAAMEEPLVNLAEATGFTVDYLGWLARRGHIEATKRGSRWYSSREAIEKYRQEAEQGKRQRGPRKRKAEE